MRMFPDAWMNELLAKSDIVSVIGEYTSLKPKGQRLWGLCPFHGEKTPSFSVTPDKQLYYCFGCHAGGNVIHFVMETERLTFPEAVKLLAQRAGMDLPEQTDDKRLQQERALKERIYAANKEAARFYFAQLASQAGKQARAYLAQRGLDAATVKRFGLGYAPQGWQNLLDHLTAKGFTREELVQGGLAQRGIKGENHVYDTFRGRILFPILGTNRRVLGFGARAMGDEQPKYLNTGDTPVFNKRYNLYALNTMRGKRVADAVVVEGYMDVISLHQAGVTNAVATLGTAMTAAQARLLKRYVSRVYLCYDGDAAGQNATLRGMDILAAEGLSVRVIRVPGGSDPDEFVREQGKDAFAALKDTALTIPRFRLDHMAQEHDLNSEDGREAYAKDACRYIGGLQPVERERYYSVVAKKTGITLEALTQQGGRETAREALENRPGRFRNTREKLPDEPESERMRLERRLIRCMAAGYDTAIAAMEQTAENLFEVPAHERFAAELLSAYAQTRQPSISSLLAGMESADAEQVASALAAGYPEEKLTPEVAKACVRGIENCRLEERMQELSQEAHRQDISPERRLELTEMIRELTGKLPAKIQP